MNQIYFTFCCTNYSLSRLGGDRARAASGGITESKAKTYKDFSYDNPAAKLVSLGLSPGELFSRAPVALRWSSTPRQTLSHTVLAPADRETRREGNYFSHLLGDFAPNECDSWKAINLWGSPFWQRADSQDISTILPEIRMDDIPAGCLSDTEFFNFLCADDSNRKMFKFLLNAWIARFASNSSNKIVMMTDDTNKIAYCLWGLMRSLPSFCWKNLTFSTYERIGKILPNLDVIGFWQPSLSVVEERSFYGIINRQNYNYFPSQTWQDPFAGCRCALADGIVEFWLNRKWKFFDKPYFSEEVRDMELEWLIRYQPEKAAIEDLWKGLESPTLQKIIWQSKSQKENLCQDACNALSTVAYQGEKMAFLLRTFPEPRNYFAYWIAALAQSDNNLPQLKLIWNTWLTKYRSEFPDLESYLLTVILPDKVGFETFEYIASKVWMDYQAAPTPAKHALVNAWNNVLSIQRLRDYFIKYSEDLNGCKEKLSCYCLQNGFNLDHFWEVVQLLQDDKIAPIMSNILCAFCQEMAIRPQYSRYVAEIVSSEKASVHLKLFFWNSLNESDRDKIASQICKEYSFMQIRGNDTLHNIVQSRLLIKEPQKKRSYKELWEFFQWGLLSFLLGGIFCLIMVLLFATGLLRLPGF